MAMMGCRSAHAFEMGVVSLVVRGEMWVWTSQETPQISYLSTSTPSHPNWLPKSCLPHVLLLTADVLITPGELCHLTADVPSPAGMCLYLK